MGGHFQLKIIIAVQTKEMKNSKLLSVREI